MSNRDKQIESGQGSGSGAKRRMYDCNTCKRGFTNPQALGGHMNLHREKPSEFKPSLFSSSHSFPFSDPYPSLSSSLDFTNPNYNTPPPYFPTIDSGHRQGFHTPINPTYNTQYFGSSSSSSSGGGNYAQGEFLGLDLSLGLGSMNVNDDTHRRPPDAGGSQPQDDDLDLDLRLGGDHN